MKLPFVLCGISPNGSVLAVRMSGGKESETLARHYETEGFRLPMTIVVIDQDNECRTDFYNNGLSRVGQRHAAVRDFDPGYVSGGSWSYENEI